DVLIPSVAAISRVFSDGRETWTQFVDSAQSLAPDAWPVECADPSIMLKDIPALPKSLPNTDSLLGHPVWNIPAPEQAEVHTNCDLNHVYGLRKELSLRLHPKPIDCDLGSVPLSDCISSTRCLSILTLCWSYIISVRFLELQGKKIRYSRCSSRHKGPREGDVVLRLEAPVSDGLVRWLRAILSPETGWSVEGGGYPAWAASCNAHFDIRTTNVVTMSRNERPPDSAQATELLIEFCSLYGLGPPGESESFSPATAAFLTALTLPFCRYVKLKPRFPVPSLTRCDVDRTLLHPIRQYVTDLRYYMTLSMDPLSVGSVIWSIFWQPDIQCNLVSPWLGATLSVIRPIIDSGNMALLGKVFAFRRPRVAMLWLGIFFSGDCTILSWIIRYLETLEERYGFGSMAAPDTAVAAWTGVPQSFLDDDKLHANPSLTERVSAADLLRHRYNHCLQDAASAPLSWLPFASFDKNVIEMELWPWLERGHVRTYVHWVWWINNTRQVEKGFHNDTGRFAAHVPDRLQIRPSGRPGERNPDVNLEPSKNATLRMVYYLSVDASGDQDRGISLLNGTVGHKWLEDW
ncbi:hypothetical protein CONLIGDRAFT_547286, partial [Coniochaeta ligniaria NRRL 30616]